MSCDEENTAAGTYCTSKSIFTSAAASPELVRSELLTKSVAFAASDTSSFFGLYQVVVCVQPA